jgi:hypothetical protein
MQFDDQSVCAKFYRPQSNTRHSHESDQTKVGMGRAKSNAPDAKTNCCEQQNTSIVEQVRHHSGQKGCQDEAHVAC